LGVGLFKGGDIANPFTRDQVLDDQRDHPGGGEVSGVVDPDRVRGIGGPRRERSPPARGRPGRVTKGQVMVVQHPPHRRWRYPEQPFVRSAVSQAPMREVPLAELFESIEDRCHLLGGDRIHHRPGFAVHHNPVLICTVIPAAQTPRLQAQYLTDPRKRESFRGGFGDQVHQSSLGPRLHPGWDRVGRAQSQPPFFSSRVTFTASSFTVSVNRATSAWAASNSRSRIDFPPRPGRAAANAARAPSLAVLRIRTIVDRSTPASIAAWFIVISPRINRRKISYFVDGDNTVRRRLCGDEFVVICHTLHRGSQDPTKVV